jgi:hypothetical protein
VFEGNPVLPMDQGSIGCNKTKSCSLVSYDYCATNSVEKSYNEFILFNRKGGGRGEK